MIDHDEVASKRQPQQAASDWQGPGPSL